MRIVHVKILAASGKPLRGENTYRLHVPPSVPVGQFWALTIYNSETQALFLNLTRPTLDHWTKVWVRTPMVRSVFTLTEVTRRPGIELDSNPGRKELVFVVSILCPAEGSLRHKLDDAGR
jgi:Protein of unknown function (DUF1214)